MHNSYTINLIFIIKIFIFLYYLFYKKKKLKLEKEHDQLELEVHQRYSLMGCAKNKIIMFNENPSTHPILGLGQV